MQCPCDLNKIFSKCCGLYIGTTTPAPSAELLMRSRYTAYNQANIDYIAKTMRGPAMQGFSKKAAKEWASKAKWQSLQIINVTETTVEFIAKYIINNKLETIHENSLFKKSKGKWFYIDKLEPPNN